MPVFKPDYPVGMLDLQADKDENLWLAMMDQGKIAKFDTKTLKFQIWDLSRENVDLQQINFLMPLHDDIDGKVRTSDSELGELRRLDVRTGKFDVFEAFENAPGGPQGHRFYEITADSQNNCHFMDMVQGISDGWMQERARSCLISRQRPIQHPAVARWTRKTVSG